MTGYQRANEKVRFLISYVQSNLTLNMSALYFTSVNSSPHSYRLTRPCVFGVSTTTLAHSEAASITMIDDLAATPK